MPVLSLIDECLHSTNSHDRRVGADAVIRGLVKRSAIGLVRTHDLALTAITDALGARAENVHFTNGEPASTTSCTPTWSGRTTLSS